MKTLTDPSIEKYRITIPNNRFESGPNGPQDGGIFYLPRGGVKSVIACIATIGEGWDHVSVSILYPDDTRGTPLWDDMERVFRLFFKEDETAYQLHVPRTEHVNIHNNVLHIWRPHKGKIPKPPRVLI